MPLGALSHSGCSEAPPACAVVRESARWQQLNAQKNPRQQVVVLKVLAKAGLPGCPISLKSAAQPICNTQPQTLQGVLESIATLHLRLSGQQQTSTRLFQALHHGGDSHQMSSAHSMW
jgi:hypothetical protein